jgi:NADPH:quinone reductase-like Zn-dependent oxidoreductase
VRSDGAEADVELVGDLGVYRLHQQLRSGVLQEETPSASFQGPVYILVEVERRDDVDRLSLKPPNLSFEQVAAVPLAALTALQAVRTHGQVEAGNKVLIIGAFGGVGTFAVEIANATTSPSVWVVTGRCQTTGGYSSQTAGSSYSVETLVVICSDRSDAFSRQCSYRRL